MYHPSDRVVRVASPPDLPLPLVRTPSSCPLGLIQKSCPVLSRFSRAHVRACVDDPFRDSYTLILPFRSMFSSLMSTSPTHTLSQCATVNNSVEALNEEKTVVACPAPSSSRPPEVCSKSTQEDAPQNQQPAVVVSRLRFFLIMASLWIGNFTAYLNETTSTTAMHVISAEFNDLANQNWLATAYLLGFTVTQTLLGKFSDIFGRAQVLLGTMLIFGAGTLWCGLATVGILTCLTACNAI